METVIFPINTQIYNSAGATRFWNNLHKVRASENAKAKTKRNKHHRQLKSNGYFQVSNGIVRNN